MHPFNKLLAKKRAEGMKPMSPVERAAKMKVVQNMGKEMSGQMAEPLHNLKKVSVASDSPEGLKLGLDKAKSIVGGQDEDEQNLAHGGLVEDHAPGMEEDASNPDDGDIDELEEETGDDLDHDNEDAESPEHISKVMEGHAEQHASDLEHLTPEEIDKKIHELTMMKQSFHSKHGGGFPR